MVIDIYCKLKFNYIIQISDIHIRLYKRQNEYKEYFETFYNELRNITNNDKYKDKTCLVISGDLFHTKTSLSAEAVDLASDFLRSCADIIPTVIIPGNHDFLLSNRNRLDNISPIIGALDHKNLYYLKDTGLYRFGNILFNNFSAFDEHEPEKYITYDKIPEKEKYSSDYFVALCHAAFNGSVNDIGYTIENRLLSLDLFNGHDITLLGDIHKQQILQEYNKSLKKPLVAYAGSFIQQDYGESLDNHGYLLWDLRKRSFDFIKLKHNYGFYTIKVEDGNLKGKIPLTLPHHLHLRILCCNSMPTQLKEIVDRIKDKYDLVETTYVRTDCLNTFDQVQQNNVNITLSNIFDPNYQNKFIEDFLKSKGASQDIIEEVKKLNIDINNKVSKEKKINSIRWKPKKFEFDNMFSYGEGNLIDFTKLNGIIGLFAKNSAGKSSILEALTFCIFDKFSKGFKASDVINNQKNSFWCKFNFEINGEDYFIERSGEFTKRGNVPVSVQFYKVVNGRQISLNGDARSSTNDIIRDYLGTYEDFILTVLSIQNNKYGSFIDLSQSERKDMLCQFMGLTIFDQLSKISNDEYKEVSVLLKNIDIDQLTENKSKYAIQIENSKTILEEYKDKTKLLESDKKEYTDKLIEISAKISSFKEKTIDINKLNKDKVTYENKIKLVNEKLTKETELLKKYDNELKDRYDTLDKAYKKYNIIDDDDLENKYNNFTTVSSEYTQKNSEVERLRIIIKTKKDKVEKLKNHKYNPNCEYCVNNEFVKDALQAQEELKSDYETAKILVNEFTTIETKLKEISFTEVLYKSVKKEYNNINTAKLHKSEAEKNIEYYKSNIKDFEYKLNEINENIEEYHKNEVLIKENLQYKEEEKNIKNKIKDCNNSIKSLNDNIITVSSNISRYESNIETIDKQISDFKSLEVKSIVYNYYTMAIDRNGVPYNIIQNELPNIENEINTILHQIVDFSVKLETDGKNIITLINYNDNRWSLEMCGGMEKFISSLAIRIALIKISNLPRPNILCIDEGFGCVDLEHLDLMGNLFSYLKNQFDFIWVVSHIDQLKDIVDLQLEIEKEGNFSKILV